MKQGLIFLFCILSHSIFSQQFGGNPPSIKWRQIHTDTARIIFPEGLDSQGQRVASIVHAMAMKNTTIGNRLYKINIVLQNQTTIANGYVGLGPYRSEFFLTPSMNNFDLGTIPWADALAVHEYRHVQQINNYRVGASKLLYYLFGEDGLALGINASVPDWFYEGDAVHAETVHSQQGRGRIPFFTKRFPTIWSEGKNYSWMKTRNGSLKDYVPSHYHLGYLLVNHGYEKYGNDFWKKVTHDAAAYKGLFYPFQQAVKRHAGIKYEEFTKNAFESYKASMSKDISRQEGTAVFPLNKNYVTNYQFPHYTEEGNLVYLRSSYRHLPAFFIKEKDRTRKIRRRDISLDDYFSYSNGRIIYSAWEPNIRWGWKDHGVLKVIHTETGKQVRLASKTKYFSPDISHSGNRIVAVNFDPSGKSELHVLDMSSGNVIQRLKSNEINLFTDPKFIDDTSLITIVRLEDGRTALAHCDINTGAIVRLSPPTYSVMGNPQVFNNRVYFTASFDGNDDIYALDLGSKRIFQITSGGPGNYFVHTDGSKLVYSTFTGDGYQLREQPLPDSSKLVEVFLKSDMDEMRKGLDSGIFQLTDIPRRDFDVNKYSKSTGLINLHSWRPNYEDPIFSFSVYGENVLNTFQTELYYLYNEDENTNAAGFNIAYGALFPYISAGTEFTFNRRGIANNLLREWNQLDSRIGLNVPLNFTRGKYFRFLNFGSSYVLRNEFNTGPNKDIFREFNFTYLSHFISYNKQNQRALQHIYPHFGYRFLAQHRHAITELEGYQFAGEGDLFLPGFLNTHNIVLGGSFQQRDTSLAIFSTRFNSARGYEDYYRTNAGSRMWTLSANYHLPLLIPDWGFGNMLYFQRLRSNLFYDFQRLFSNDKKFTADLRSTGIEFYLDTKWWNQYEISFGVRLVRLLDDDPLAGRASGSNLVEFILPVSIIQD